MTTGISNHRRGRSRTMSVTALTTSELTVLSAALVRAMPALVRAMPALDAAELRLAVAVYHELATGEPVSLERLATRVGLAAAQVAEILDRWPGVYRDNQGALIGFWGLTQQEMPPHRFEVAGQRLWTWCSWDSLFIPVILGQTAHGVGVCDDRRAGFPGRHARGRRGGRTPWRGDLVPAPRGEVRPDVIASFCHHVLFFSSEEAGRQWIAERPNPSSSPSRRASRWTARGRGAVRGGRLALPRARPRERAGPRSGAVGRASARMRRSRAADTGAAR